MKPVKNPFGRSALCAALWCVRAAAAPGSAPATNAPAEIVVAASRDAQPAANIAGHVSVIPGEAIARSGAASVVEAMEQAGGIHFRSTSGNASQAEVYLRGIGENSHGRVLVLQDGRKLNNPDMAGINWLQIPAGGVDHIEILRGSQSSLYGDHAVGGVINIVTKTGGAEPETDLQALGGSYGLNSERADTRGSAGGLDYAAFAGHDATDGYRARSAYRAWSGGGNAGFDLGDRASLSADVSYNQMDFELPGYLTREQLRQDPRQSTNPDDSAANEYWNGRLGLSTLAGDAGRLDVNANYSHREQRSDMVSWGAFTDTAFDSIGVLPRYVRDGAVLGHRQVFLAGVDYCRDALDVDRYGEQARAARTASATITKETAGLYLNDQCYLTERLVLGLGGRSEQGRISGEVFDAGGARVVDADKTHRVNVGDAALLYHVGRASKVFVRAGQVYRYPFVDEQLSYYGFGADRLYRNIETEKGENYETGFEAALASNVTAGVTLFRLNMRNEINYNGATMQNENMDRDRRQGVEASCAVRPADGCRLSASYTYTDAEFTGGANDGRELPLAPRHEATAAAELDLPGHLTFSAALNYVGEQVLGGDYANTQERLDAYTTVDAGLRYVAVHPKGLQIFAGVDNVFDERYAAVAYKGLTTDGYYPAAGRTYKAGVSQRF